MKHTIRTLIVFVAMTIAFTVVVSATLASDVPFIYYRGGLASPTVEVENRLLYKCFGESVDEWNSTDTPVEIIQVPGSGHSYVIAGQFDDTWYGLYTPRSQNIFTGRAGKFKIELNRTTLVTESDTVWKSVLVHELGHAFCLSDNPSSGNQSIMNYDRNRNYLTWPTADDIAGVNDAYN
ncbi:MAG: hypothetical protein HFF60_13295 [Oscillospiraceae bacterium]|nr:hypothetical protein [Oscillospiraceae bacterium]